MVAPSLSVAVEEEDVPVRQLPFGRVTAEAAGRRCPVHPPALAAGAGAQH